MFAHFNHSQFRKYIAAFGRLFSQIEVRRGETVGGVPPVPDDAVSGRRIRVPIEYGPKERWYTKTVQDPNSSQGVRVIVPRLGYELKSIQYDGSRKLNTLHRVGFPTETARKLARLYVPAPYKLTFELSALVKLQSDGFEITEQILPYFTPELTFALNVIPEFGLIDTIPVTLTGVNSSDLYEGDFEKNRMIQWDFTFAMNVNFWGLRRKQARIEEVILDIFSVSGDLATPPEVLATEGGSLLVNEDGSGGHLMDESTSNTYIGTEMAARITTTADPSNQEPIRKEDITYTEVIERFVDGADD